ncbi:MAG: nitroreductase family protein [Acidimicrobiales bacterium]|nr:nitroreductase family protein [Acidimicrobiales bacterium]MDG2217836.1 nitroreductase family protein [Acidimicrobiales bacterium]
MSDSRPMSDSAGILDAIATTRSIRRYLDEPVPDDVLRDICFAASRAPSGSNRQNFRMIVLTDGPDAAAAKQLVASAAHELWAAKRRTDGYESGSGIDDKSPKARMARSMDAYIENLPTVPALIFPCLIRHRAPTPTEGASVYPAMQNLLLAARARGYGGVVTMWHMAAEKQLTELLEIPEGVFVAATVTLGKPAGAHGPVRRQPLAHFIYDGTWGNSPHWATDPPGTRYTNAGPTKD